MKSMFCRGMRGIVLLLGLSVLLTALASCGGEPAQEENVQPMITPSGRVVDAGADEIPQSVYGDIRNIYYTLYNMQVPMLYVKLPEKAASYGYAARDTAALDAFLESEFIDTLDAGSLFSEDPDAYYGRYAECFNADGALELAKQIIGLMPDYYSLMLKGAKNFEEGYYERVDCEGCGHSDLTKEEDGWYYRGTPVSGADALTLEESFEAEDYFYYRPVKKTEYRVRCYGTDISSRASKSGSYDEVIFDSVALNTALAEGTGADASRLMLWPDAVSVTVMNQNNAGLENHVYLDRGVNLLLLHNLDDLTLAAILADSVTKVTAVDIRGFESETLVSYLKDDKSYDLAVMAIVPDGNWDNINRGNDVVNAAYSDEKDHSSFPVKDNHRMLQVCYPLLNKNVETYVKNMTGLHDACEELGTELVFVQTAYKNFRGYTELPGGLVCHANDNADNFLEELQKNGIRTIDLRERILADIPGDQVFYKTDHHWKAESGFWAAGQLIEYMRSELGWSELDPDGTLCSPDSYVYEVREHDFMAHFGKDYNHSMVGCDDFTLIYPKFDTKFVMTIDRNGKKETTKGTFYEALFTKHYLQGRDPCAYNRYAAYLNGDQPLIKIENQTEGIAKSDKKVLVVKCSFANAVNPYLAMNFETFQIIDLRHYKLATLTEYITQNHFDLVMFIYNPNLYGNQNMFRFK